MNPSRGQFGTFYGRAFCYNTFRCNVSWQLELAGDVRSAREVNLAWIVYIDGKRVTGVQQYGHSEPGTYHFHSVIRGVPWLSWVRLQLVSSFAVISHRFVNIYGGFRWWV